MVIHIHITSSWEVYRIIIHLTHVGKPMEKPCSCIQFIKTSIFYRKSRENSYQYYKSRENLFRVPQVTCAASERAKVRMISPYIVPSYTGINYHSFVAVDIVTHASTRNNTDGNKLVIFSCIASYYGDDYITITLLWAVLCVLVSLSWGPLSDGTSWWCQASRKKVVQLKLD